MRPGHPWRLGLSAAILALWPGLAAACLVCIAVPEDSLADRALAGEAVALLRPSPEDPFRFVPIAFLKGSIDLPPVPFLVSRTAAATFAADPAAVTVGIFSPADGWSLHDQGTVALGKVLAAALAADLATEEARMAFFGPLAAHPDPAVQQMALIELASLPYPILRQVGAQPDRQQVLRRAADPLWSEWAPVMILLLGTSDDPSDARLVRAAVERLARAGHDTHLAAWATALIEMDGLAGITALERGFPADARTASDTVLLLAVALADHATRRDAVGDAALDSLLRLAEARPEVLGYLSRALLQRKDWSLAEPLARLRDRGLIADPADEFVVSQYIAAATAAPVALP